MGVLLRLPGPPPIDRALLPDWEWPDVHTVLILTCVASTTNAQDETTPSTLLSHEEGPVYLGGLGDGALRYGRERIVESYYTAHLWRGVSASAGVQFIANPGYNEDRGPVLIETFRMHVDF